MKIEVSYLLSVVMIFSLAMHMDQILDKHPYELIQKTTVCDTYHSYA